MSNEELEMRIAELESEVERLKGNYRKANNLASVCRFVPYTAIRYSREHDKYYFATGRSETWNTLREMSKKLFLTDRDCIITHHYHRPCTNTPKKVADLSTEQLMIAAEFLDEVISIFNKYFVRINSEVTVEGETIKVEVLDVEPGASI